MIARAAEVSIETIFACGVGEVTKADHNIPGIEKSAAYCAWPETFSRPSTRYSLVSKTPVFGRSIVVVMGAVPQRFVRS